MEKVAQPAYGMTGFDSWQKQGYFLVTLFKLALIVWVEEAIS
jgi:hypothetical protein